jgi:hypothetical protein
MGSPLPRTPKDGCLFFEEPTGRVYLFLDGGLRWVQNPELYHRLFEIPLAPTSHHFKQFSEPIIYPILHPIPLEAGLVRPAGYPQVFLIDIQDGRLVKRHIVNQEILAQHHFTFNDVREMPAEFFDHYPAGTPIGPVTPRPQSGRLFHDDRNGRVSLLLDYEIRPIASQEVFNRLFAVPLDPNHPAFHRYSLYSGFAEGEPITNESRFIRADGDEKIYLVDTVANRPIKRHVKNPQAFERCHFCWNKVHNISPEEVARIPVGCGLV